MMTCQWMSVFAVAWESRSQCFQPTGMLPCAGREYDNN